MGGQQTSGPAPSCVYCRVGPLALLSAANLVCECAQPCSAGRCTAAAAQVGMYAAGTVQCGPSAGWVHLVRQDTIAPRRWQTACPADGYESDQPRQVQVVCEPVTCPDCIMVGGPMVASVAERIQIQHSADQRVRDVLEGFFQWAASDQDGVLAGYFGDIRLVPLSSGQRERLISRWVEQSRRYPLSW